MERAHLYTTNSKQQIALIQVGEQCDDKEIILNQHNGICFLLFYLNKYMLNDVCIVTDLIDTNLESLNDDNSLHKSPNFSSQRLSLLDTQTG